MIRDLLGRQVLNPYPVLEDYRADPVIFFLTIKEDWTEFDISPQIFQNCLESEILLHPQQPYLSKTVYGLDWTMAYYTYYIPLPNMPYLMRLKCSQEYSSTIYFKVESKDAKPILYMEEPSLSPLGERYCATDVLDINVKWKERLSLNRRTEARPSIHRKPETKPYGETGTLYKCMPGRTFLIQDCFWSEATNYGVPDIRANKQMLVMSDLILKEQTEAAYIQEY